MLRRRNSARDLISVNSLPGSAAVLPPLRAAQARVMCRISLWSGGQLYYLRFLLRAAELRQGDMVRHRAFGRGMVMSVQPMGGDALLEIAFDEVGTKRLMRNSAMAYLEKEGG